MNSRFREYSTPSTGTYRIGDIFSPVSDTLLCMRQPVSGGFGSVLYVALDVAHSVAGLALPVLRPVLNALTGVLSPVPRTLLRVVHLSTSSICGVEFQEKEREVYFLANAFAKVLKVLAGIVHRATQLASPLAQILSGLLKTLFHSVRC